MLSESGVVISLTISDCILTDLGVANLLDVCLDGVCNMGFLMIFSGDDFPVMLGNLEFFIDVQFCSWGLKVCLPHVLHLQFHLMLLYLP